MAGDPLRDAFRAELDIVIAAASPAITWLQKDTVNTSTNPDASTGYFELEFPGASEDQYTFGNSGADIFNEFGQVTLRVVAPLGRQRSNAEGYAEQLRDAFRMRRFNTADSREVRILSTMAMGAGQTEAGLWAESVGIAYRVEIVG